MTITDQKQVVFELPTDALKAESGNSDRLVYGYYFKPLVLSPPGNPDPDDVDVLEQLLKSELGHLFLDRTRIRPKGFVLGEHLQSLSLAPGEEVVVEQKTFSKRESSYEQVSESERQFDLELSSTLSTELSEGLERAQSRTEQTGFQTATSLGAQVEVPLEAVDVGANVKQDLSWSQNVTDANSQSARRSIKDSATNSAKVASKYRAMHKTTFKVSTEDRFESTAKRVFRNPNPYTPIDLHYWKIMQRLELTQERWGVRLCWAPSVADPASEVTKRLQLGRQAIIDRVMGAVELPPRPSEPVKPNYPTRVETSPQKEADKWGFTGDMSADYDLPVEIPNGYVWNGDIDEVRRLSSVWGRPPENMGWYVVGTPWVADAKLWVRIHVGAGSWIGGPKVFMQARAKFLPKAADEDPAYKAAYEKWLGDVARWEAEVAELRAAPMARALEDAEAWEAALLASLNPVSEVMDRIIKAQLGGELSDERWEVDFWNEIFDWERAGLSLSPGYWTKNAPRDALKGPDHFLNASWARLYLPVRPGKERIALRWIIGHVRGDVLDAPTEEAIGRLTSELSLFRQTSFGDPLETKVTSGAMDEQFLTLARWTETLPTDGTHAEVVQAATHAVDSNTNVEIESARRLASIRAAEEEQDIELKKRAVTHIGTNASNKLNYTVEIATTPEDGDQRPG